MSVLIIHMKYLRVLVVIFVIFSAVVGLSIQEVTQLELTLSESTRIVEAGGKIIDVELSDGVQTVVDPQDFTELLNKKDQMDLGFKEFLANNPIIQTLDDVEDKKDLGFQEFLHPDED